MSATANEKRVRTRAADARPALEPIDAGGELMRAIRRIIHSIDKHSKQVARGSGLTLPQIVVLDAIRRLGDVTSSAISAQANLTPATVTTILDNLEERGLVSRRRSETDRRVVHARLTARGARTLDAVPRPLHGALLSRFAALPAARRRALTQALNDVADLLHAPREL